MENKEKTGPRIHRHTLVEMNQAVFTARRDIAHERVVTLLKEHLHRARREERAACYRLCVRVIEDALMATRRSQIQRDSPLIHYLRLLQETLQAQLSLVNHELMLARESRALSRLLGEKTIAELQTASDLFSTSERNILESIGDLLKFGAPILARDTRERLDSFSADDRRRYEVAKTEFHTFYAERMPPVAEAGKHAPEQSGFRSS
jgi:hypothetical protein